MGSTSRGLTSMRKRKCKACGEFWRPEESTPDYVRWCSYRCREALALQALQKVRAQAKRQADQQRTARRQRDRQKLVSMRTVRDWLKIAQRAFNRYIRLRDRKRPCISCGRLQQDTVFGGAFDAGHYRSTGSASHLRFTETNCWSQCVQCNRDLSGNTVEYRKGLIRRIGVEEVERLEEDNRTHKWTIPELEEIAKKYNRLARELEKLQ